MMASPCFSRGRAAVLFCGGVLALVALAWACEESEPAADLSEELSGGVGPFIGSASGGAVPDGYVVHEYVAAGVATAYAAPDGLRDDGRFHLEPATTAAYRTRVLVRRPSNVPDASGLVVVEWLNVSGGIDADPEYATLVEEITRRGHTWVGVSAQLIGVEGGPVAVSIPGAGGNVAGKGLKAIDPARYGSLSHPGDGYSFDIFTQVARAIRNGDPMLGGVTPRFVIAAGESQSAIALTTYYDGVQPLTRAFDGFFVHSRAGGTLPLVGPGEYADITGAVFGWDRPVFRDDLTAPVMDIQAEGDVTGLLGSYAARQPDGERFRLWEIAGTAHADAHLLGSTAAAIDCGGPINDGPLHVVAKAAFRALETWVSTGNAPPMAARLELDTNTGAVPQLVRDDDGLVLGGLRTPPVDVPVDVLSGAPGSDSVACLLFGSTTPLTDARIAELYASRADYTQQWDVSADAAVQAGFVLADDRDALLAYAKPLRVGP